MYTHVITYSQYSGCLDTLATPRQYFKQSVLFKSLEHTTVCHSLHKHFDKYNILTSLNHGFRSGYSCETQLTVTVDQLARNVDKGLQTDIAILDLYI